MKGVVPLMLLAVVGFPGCSKTERPPSSQKQEDASLRDDLSSDPHPLDDEPPPRVDYPPLPVGSFADAGSFRQVSESVVITDPGYDLATAKRPGLGVVYTNCFVGDWMVRCAVLRPPDVRWQQPGELVAFASTLSHGDIADLDWKEHEHVLGGDYAMIGIYDLAHFHNDSGIPGDQRWTFDGKPADPDDLWYSMNCETGRGRASAAVVPHGCLLHWDGGLRLYVGRDDVGLICAFRFVVDRF